MRFFSRRARDAVQPAPENGDRPDTNKPAEEEPRIVAVAPVPLTESLQQVYALRPTREAFAEEALRLIAASAGVRTAALFGYEPRKERLRVIAHLNLEPDAVAVLAGESALSTWDIPSRALRNRRISVIEAAHENPFVPKPLVAINPRRLTIATIPFYHANQPVGTVVLFSPTARGFGDKLLQALAQGLRVAAVGLAELPSAAVTEVHPSDTTADQPKLLRGLNALKAELARLRQQLDEVERQRTNEAMERVTAQSFLQAERERSAMLDKELQAAREQLTRLPGAEEQVRTLEQQLADSRIAHEAAAAQATALESALTGARERVDEQSVAAAALEATRDDLQTQLAAALAAAGERGERVAELERQARELSGRTARLDALERAIAEGERDRAAQSDEIERFQAQLTAAQSARADAELQLRQATDGLTAAQTEVRELTAQIIQARAQVRDLSGTPEELSEARAQLRSLERTHADLQHQVERLQAERTALTGELENAQREGSARVQGLQSERDRLHEELVRARKDGEQRLADLLSQIDGVERDRQQMAGRIDELSVVQAERARLRARAEELEHELANQQEVVHALEARIEELGQVSARLIAERRELHSRIETLAAGGQTLEQEKQAAINTAQERVTALEAELGRLTAAQDTARAAATEELSRVRGELTAAVQGREEAQRELARVHQHAEALAREAKEHTAAQDRLRRETEELTRERAALAEQLQTAGRELARLRQARAEGDRGLATIESELRETARARDAVAAELRALRDETLAQTTARLAAAEAARGQLETTLAGDRARHAAEVAALQEEMARLREEADAALADARHAFEVECERLTQALAEKDLLLQSAEDGIGLIGMPAAGGDGDSELTIDRSSAPLDGGELEADEADDLLAEAGPDEIVFFDSGKAVEESERHLTQFGHQVATMAPTADVLAHLADRRMTCAALNLAIPAAWSTLRALKSDPAHCRRTLLAYALAPDAPAGFWFGTVDFLLLPVAKNLTEVLVRLAPRIKRVLAMSNDIDVMSDVRTHLTGIGVSTAVVLDGRQALDLVPTVRPEAAVLHLSPSCVDVFRAVQGLRAAEISRDIPILFLLDATAQPREEAFLSAGVRMLSSRGNLRADQLGATVSLALDAVQAAAAAAAAAPAPRDHQQVGPMLA